MQFPKKGKVLIFLGIIFLNGCGLIWVLTHPEEHFEWYASRYSREWEEAEELLKNYIGKTKEDVLRDFGKPRVIWTAEKVPYIREEIGADEVWDYRPRGKWISYEFYFKDGIVIKAKPD